MLRKLLVLGAIFTTAFAVAQSSVEGAAGMGAARNGEGRIGEFDFHVVKFTDGTNVRFEGRLVFASSAVLNNHNVHVQLRLHRLEALDANGNVCEFGGRGVLIIRTPTGLHEVRGRINARVQDNRNHQHPTGEPDQFAIRFVAAEGNLTYDFAGLVTRGDLQVRDGGR